jgi:peptide/nickel transport system permease protein
MAGAEPYTTEIPPRRRDGRLRVGWRESSWPNRAALAALGIVFLVAVVGPILAPFDPAEPAGQALSAPSLDHPFGTDEVGRDILSRVLTAVQTTWWSAMAVIASGILFGGLLGLIAGAAGGWVDAVIMRTTDLFLALPGAILAIALVAALGPSLFHTLLAVSIVWWPLYARVIRGEVRAWATRPHMDAARLAGVGPMRRAWRHLLPGALPATIVAASLDVGLLILTLATLSFLGLGQLAPAPELGSMVARGLPYLLQQWWVPILPGLAVFALALVGNVGGDALRDSIKDR